MTLQQMGDLLGVKRQRAQQMKVRAIGLLRKAFHRQNMSLLADWI